MPTDARYGHLPSVRAAGRVLVIEDDVAVIRVVERSLRAAGFETIAALEGHEGMALARGKQPDLVLCDIGMPGMDGHTVLQQLRQDERTRDIPFIFLTGSVGYEDMRLGMRLGADDYLTKPYGMRELAARIRAVMRRAATPSAAATAAPSGPAGAGVQEIGRLAIDRRTQRVHVDGAEVQLTAKEFDVLAYLAEDPGAVRRRTEILEHVWDGHWYGATKTVDAHVAAIRKKLGDPAWVEAVRGVGFRLGAP